MAQQYQYIYAVIDPELGDMCIGVQDTTVESDDPDHILIPYDNGEYLMKYYNRADGKWYYDAEFTNEWIPA